VPPSLHKTVTGSSVFGSPRSDSGKDLPGPAQSELNGLPLAGSQVSPENDRAASRDRSKWKTLRDFIDERSIEEALERIEEERLLLDVCHA
jgi:autophagy-related protein 17